ncbi:MAG: Spx/MgsR family RNA polymerase-binding regulatory protein [Ferruginibacter sp.]
MAEIKLYGIPNCDTTKKAMAWLEKHKLAFSFHDYKLAGISEQKLEYWCDKKGWETVFNKRSTSWRQLSEAEQKKITHPAAAIKQMMLNNSIIKRPVIEFGRELLVGFDEEEYKKTFK